MYKLYAPHITKDDNKFFVTQKLFKEILGYTDDEINYFAETHFSCDVVINLTLKQAQEICAIFYSNDISLYLRDQQTNKSLYWQKDLGIVIPREPPKSHYCDEPLVTRDHLVDAFTEQEKERQQNIQEAQREEREKRIVAKNTNVPTCPTCGSTKVHPISSGKKALGFITVGIFSNNFGKSYECDNCKYKW